MNLDDHSEAEIANSVGNQDVKRLLKHIEDNGGVVGLLVVSQSTLRLCLRQVMIGICRGFGFTIGGTAVLAIIYQILSYLISMNIPFLTDLLKQIVSILKGA